jgi:hypothetical protein
MTFKEIVGLGQLPDPKPVQQGTVTPVSPGTKAFAEAVAVGPTVHGRSAPDLKAKNPTRI